LEKAVLHSEEVVRLLNSKGVAPVKVDLTGNNTEGNQKLIEVGRRTIPYLVVYSRDGQQIFASDAYTVEQLTGALKKAGEHRKDKTHQTRPHRSNNALELVLRLRFGV
jgi:glutaredoxin